MILRLMMLEITLFFLHRFSGDYIVIKIQKGSPWLLWIKYSFQHPGESIKDISIWTYNHSEHTILQIEEIKVLNENAINNSWILLNIEQPFSKLVHPRGWTSPSNANNNTKNLTSWYIYIMTLCPGSSLTLANRSEKYTEISDSCRPIDEWMLTTFLATHSHNNIFSL